MARGRILAGIVAAAVLVQALPAQSAKGSPGEAVKRFYTTYHGLKFSGLPTAKQLSKLAPYLSASLQSTIRAAQKEQDRCEKAAPDEKPPWVEGDMFSSNFEGFTRFQVQAGAETTVSFEYADRGQKSTWKDRVMIVNEQGRWVVDDVVYGRTEGFGNGFGSNLRASLSGSGCEGPR